MGIVGRGDGAQPGGGEVTDAMGSVKMDGQRPKQAAERILVMCPAIVGSRMASPGIRNFNIARTLQKHLPDSRVTLSLPPKLPSDLDPSSVPFDVVWADGSELRDLVARHDLVVTSKFPLKLLPAARNTKLALDLYTPFYTEWMEMSKNDPGTSHRRSFVDTRRRNLIAQLAAADVVLTANERQRDLVLGMMGTLGMVSAFTYDRDPTLQSLVRLAPLGTRPVGHEARPPILKGVHPGIRKDDFVLIWNGTIIEWYDIELLVRAVHRLSTERDDIKLFFMGTEHPDSFGAKPLHGLGAGATLAAMDLGRELGILDRQMFFNFGWASDAETEAYLLEADAGVCTYFNNLETRYSFRVRYLDLFWAELPLICTRGDVVSEMVDERGLGISIPEGDLEALVAAIRRLADDHAFRSRCRENLHDVREEFSWDNTMRPLIEFCRDMDSPLPPRSERMMRIGRLTGDWLVAQAHYNARWVLRDKVEKRVRRLVGRQNGN